MYLGVGPQNPHSKVLPRALDFDIINELAEGSFHYGMTCVVEFEPHSLWHEISLTAVAQALRSGVKVEYHVFEHTPAEIRTSLAGIGVDVEGLESRGQFRVLDTYTPLTPRSDNEQGKKGNLLSGGPPDVEDWTRSIREKMQVGFEEEEKRWLHIDDNETILLQYNGEDSVVKGWRTTFVPMAKERELLILHGLARGVASDSFYLKTEAMADAVIDIRTKEEEGRLENLVRLRALRGARFDSRWHRVELLASGEVALGAPPDEGTRKLAAIMFTDMVGFTAVAQTNESLALSLLDGQRRLVRPILAKHRGKEVKTIGDAFLVEFASALDAVRCAIEIQSALEEANSLRPVDRKVALRIGIHLGDVVHDGGDVAGDAVNLASRIEPLAPPGGICVSAQVQSSVVNKVDANFVSLGTPQLRNVLTPVEVYQIQGFGAQAAKSAEVGSTPIRERIAVLPFRNFSPDQSDEYFADGMTEEVISSVSRTRGLRVIARTSVMKYKGSGRSISEIGRELNVGNILEGSVRKAGDKLRINVQLVETSNEEPRWSQEYDREMRDVFEIQSDIAKKVAEALRMQVAGIQHQEPGGASTDPDAYVSYLRGRQLWNRRTKEDLERAIAFFEKALDVDPGYAQAYTGLADSYAALALLEFKAPNDVYPKAKDAVGRALSLNPDLAEAHTSLGLVRFQYDWNWKGAEEEFRKSIEINPSYAPAHHFYADYLKAMGRFDEALSEIRKAQELDPLSLAISTGVGHVLYLSGQYDQAIQQYRKAIDLDPTFLATHIWFGRPYLEKGMFREAISELETAVRLSGESTIALAMLGHGLASAGRTEDASRILEKLKVRSRSQYVPSYWIAVIYNGFRDREQTMLWMKKAFDERSSWLVWSNVEPRFSWLRAEPDFAQLLKKMKFQ